MIRDKFRRRMLLAAVLPTLIFTALLSFVWVNWIQQELETSRRDRAEAIARQLATAAEFHLFSGDLAALRALVKATAAEEGDIVGMAIYDRRGIRLVAAGASVALADQSAHAAWVENGTDGGHRLIQPIMTASLIIDDLSGEGEAPLRSGGDRTLGYVVLAVSDAALLAKRNNILYLAGFLMLLAAVAGGTLAALMSRGIVDSISGMISVVQRIGRGDPAARIEPDPECVLYPLEEGINRMAEQIFLTQEDMRRRIDDATQELQAQKRTAEYEARIDHLTRLGNRRAFMEQGEAEVQRALRYGTPVALVVLDVDHFKQVNDRHGHDVGDLVLVRLAEALRPLLREVDFMARLGGEEFAILMPDTKAAEAARVADRLRQAVADMAVTASGTGIGCTASFGVSEYQAGDSRVQDLFVRADQALYRAKQAGRNRVELAG